MAADRNAKIIAKIADNNSEVEYIKSILNAGGDVIWLNTAHQEEEDALGVIERVRSISDEIPFLIDTKGPEIRTKNVKEGLEVENGTEFILTGDESVTGENVIHAAYENLAAEVPVGTEILIEDGKIVAEVKSVDGTKLVCVAKNTGKIKNKKSINIPAVHIALPALTEKDARFVHFCAKNDVDYVIHSFVRNKKDIDEIKAILNQYENHNVKIIAKIENREGFDNIDEILENCEGLMVARGDLGVEVPFEEVPYMQKIMVNRATEMGKISIVATQALHSMVENPRPTRAEVSDVANAILDGADGVSMSDETAFGDYPIEATEAMARIMKFTEATRDELNFTEAQPISEHPMHVVAESVVHTADMSGAEVIIVESDNPKIAQTISAFRPDTPIYAFSEKKEIVRELKLSYAVHARSSADIKQTLLDEEYAAEDGVVVVRARDDSSEEFDISVTTVENL